MHDEAYEERKVEFMAWYNSWCPEPEPERPRRREAVMHQRALNLEKQKNRGTNGS